MEKKSKRNSFVTNYEHVGFAVLSGNDVIALHFVCTGKLILYSDGLRARRPGFDSRQRKEFSILHGLQTGSGARPASYAGDAGGSFAGCKAAGA
jgi:hypothetical protein